MRAVELRDDTARYVLFLENPAHLYNNVMEGSTCQRVDTQVNQFLSETTPESALQSKSKFPPPLRQLKSRGGNVRGLGTWCQGEQYDLFIIQVLFDKADERKIYAKIAEFRRRAGELQSKFSDLSFQQIEAKIDEWRGRDDLILKLHY